MRIGIYSGSFDPIHCGHAMVANYVSQWGDVDEVWLMVSRLNPLKKDGVPPADDHHRFRMAELVADSCNGVKASDFELTLPEPSYTYVTLKRLQEEYPEHSFVLIIGSDNWVNFGRWRDAGKIIRDFGIIIFPRPGFEVPHVPPLGVNVLDDVPTAHVSSSFVREAISQGANINFFVPVEVAQYIKNHNLYKNE